MSDAVPFDRPAVLSFKQYLETEKERRLEWAVGLLNHCGGNISKAAELAGIDRSNFKRILRRGTLTVSYSTAEQ